jgi:hypothetical protein
MRASDAGAIWAPGDEPRLTLRRRLTNILGAIGSGAARRRLSGAGAWADASLSELSITILVRESGIEAGPGGWLVGETVLVLENASAVTLQIQQLRMHLAFAPERLARSKVSSYADVLRHMVKLERGAEFEVREAAPWSMAAQSGKLHDWWLVGHIVAADPACQLHEADFCIRLRNFSRPEAVTLDLRRIARKTLP